MSLLESESIAVRLSWVKQARSFRWSTAISRDLYASARRASLAAWIRHYCKTLRHTTFEQSIISDIKQRWRSCACGVQTVSTWWSSGMLAEPDRRLGAPSEDPLRRMQRFLPTVSTCAPFAITCPSHAIGWLCHVDPIFVSALCYDGL
jgi:hypothetical protein